MRNPCELTKNLLMKPVPKPVSYFIY